MSRKGYGYHSFLDEYIEENDVKKILEVGVDTGENAKNMVERAIEYFPQGEVEYYGFDKFEGEKKAKAESKLSETGCRFELFKGDSRETLPLKVDGLPKMDLIFIDGGDRYEVVKSDWKNAKKLVTPDTGIFFHNYDFTGPKKVVDGISRKKFSVEILNPEKDYRTAYLEPVERSEKQ